MRGVYEVQTPENVSFEFELAGIAARSLAWVIDTVIIGVILAVTMFLLSLSSLFVGAVAVALSFIVAFLMMWWWTAFFEWWFAGRTLGKMVLGLRTIQANGLRITFMQSVIRNLARIIDLLPIAYLVGGVSVLLDKRARRLGDMAAGTIVVRQRRSPLPTRVVPPSERYNTFVSDPFVVHAASRITPPEREAMVKLSLRREDLPLATRHALFTRLSRHLEERLGIARPTYFSEEKYVLNLTAVVLSSSLRATNNAKGIAR